MLWDGDQEVIGMAKSLEPCPYLGLANNQNSCYPFQTTDHRCYRATPAQWIELGHQESFCLGDKFKECPRFARPAVYAAPEEPAVTPSKTGGVPLSPAQGGEGKGGWKIAEEEPAPEETSGYDEYGEDTSGGLRSMLVAVLGGLILAVLILGGVIAYRNLFSNKGPLGMATPAPTKTKVTTPVPTLEATPTRVALATPTEVPPTPSALSAVVIASDGAKVRKEPKTSSVQVGSLIKGQQVEVLERDVPGESVTLAGFGTSDKWLKIRVKGGTLTGYVWSKLLEIK